MTIFGRVAGWLRGSERAHRREGYAGLTGSEKFEALTMRGSLSQARKIMAEVEAELAENEPDSKPGL